MNTTLVHFVQAGPIKTVRMFPLGMISYTNKQTNKQEYSIGPVVLEITHVTTTEYAQCQISTFYIL